MQHPYTPEELKYNTEIITLFYSHRLFISMIRQFLPDGLARLHFYLTTTRGCGKGL